MHIHNILEIAFILMTKKKKTDLHGTAQNSLWRLLFYCISLGHKVLKEKKSFFFFNVLLCEIHVFFISERYYYRQWCKMMLFTLSILVLDTVSSK